MSDSYNIVLTEPEMHFLRQIFASETIPVSMIAVELAAVVRRKVMSAKPVKFEPVSQSGDV